MIHLSRRSLVLTALSVLCALVMAFGPFSFDAAADDGKAALKFAPKETAGVIAINVERLKGSPLYESLINLFRVKDSFKGSRQELKDYYGIDFDKDLNSIVFFTTTRLIGDMVGIANGTFDQAKITALLKSKGSVEEKVGGQVMLKESSGTGAVAFAGGHILFSTANMVKSVLTAGGALGADLSKLTSAVDSSKDLWIAMEIPDEIKHLTPKFAGLKSVIGSLDLSANFVLKLTFETSNAEAAQRFIEEINSFIDSINKDPIFAPLGLAGPISRLKLSASDATVHIHFDMTAAEFDTFQKAFHVLMNP